MTAVYPYQLKRFVPPSKSKVHHEQELEDCYLNGDEIKQFYDEVVNSPSTSTVKVAGQTQQSSMSCRMLRNQTRSKAKHLTFESFLRCCSSPETKDANMVTRVLSKHPDYMNSRDFYGWTPLMCAAFAGLPDIVAALLDAGADRTLRNNQNQTALNLASGNNQVSSRIVVDLLSDNFERFAAAADSAVLGLPNLNASYYCEVCDATVCGYTQHVGSTAHVLNANTRGVKPLDGQFLVKADSRGYRLMVKSGWNETSGLGRNSQGRKYPVKTVLKRDREGFGFSKRSGAARITHFGQFDPKAVESCRKGKVQSIKRRVKHERKLQLEKERKISVDLRREFY